MSCPVCLQPTPLREYAVRSCRQGLSPGDTRGGAGRERGRGRDGGGPGRGGTGARRGAAESEGLDERGGAQGSGRGHRSSRRAGQRDAPPAAGRERDEDETVAVGAQGGDAGLVQALQHHGGGVAAAIADADRDQGEARGAALRKSSLVEVRLPWWPTLRMSARRSSAGQVASVRASAQRSASPVRRTREPFAEIQRRRDGRERDENR